MKKLSMILLLAFLPCAVNAQDLLYFPHDSTWIDLEGKKKSTINFVSYADIEYVMIDNVFVYLSTLDTRRSNLKNLLAAFTSTSIIEIDVKTGYQFFINNAKCFSSIKPFKTYVLSGSDIFLLAYQPYNALDKLSFSGCVTDFSVKVSMEDGKKQRQGILYERPLQYKYLDSGIVSVSASSYLTEVVGGKTLDYRPEYMMNRICKAAEGWEFEPEFDNFMRCWSEGVPGDGIGEWLKVDFSRASDEMMVLNGYVDFGNMQAYKRNNRLKRIKVESIAPAFSIEYTFDDFVAYHTIKMPAATKAVKMTVLEVYKGDKYSDTCVTAITLPQERRRSKEAEEKEIRAYLQELGVFDYVKEYKKRQQ